MIQERLNTYGFIRNKHYFVNKTDLTITIPILNTEFIFKGLDDKEKIKSIAKITSMWIEEATELSKDDVMQLNLRLRDKTKSYHQIILSFNPISAEHWLKKHFFDEEQPDTTIIHTTYKDNRFLSKQYVEQLENLKNIDYEYYKIYALGKWGLLKGQIYTNYEIRDIQKLKDSFDTYCYGLDFGFTNDPTAFVMVGYDRKKKEIYVLDEFYETGLTNDLIAERLYEKGITDEPIICDSSEPKSIKELKNYGINAVPATKGKGSVNTGIQFIKQHKLIIDKQCINIIKELQLYKWHEDKDGKLINKPIDKWNHCITGDTLILTENGHKRIDELVNTNGKVLSYNEASGLFEYKEYYDCKLTRENAELLKIELEDGTTIKLTPDHLVYTKRGWIEAQDLDIEHDEILTIKNNYDII